MIMQTLLAGAMSLHMCLDTGAQHSFVNPSVAQALESAHQAADTSRVVTIQTPSGTAVVKVITIYNVKIKDVGPIFHNVTFIELVHPVTNMDGCIGQNILSLYHSITIDYDDQLVTYMGSK
jgi:gag-polyprotein putative aspartyl protease